MTTVAVLGLGAMGLPMATNLNKEFSVHGYDLSDERNQLAREAGISVFTSAREAVSEADAVLVAVRNAPQLNDLLYGEVGIVEVMKAGAQIILTSTVGVAVVEETAHKLQESKIGLIDAPVSGGPVRAGEGDLLVVGGAYDDEWQKALPILECMSSTLVFVGNAPGKGQAMKTVNQLLCGVHIAAAGEALALSARLGVDPKLALDALMAGAAASFMLGDRGERMVETIKTKKPAEVKSRLDIFVKDMGIVTDAAKHVGLPTPIAAAAEQEYVMGVNAGGEANDDSSVISVVAPELGV